MFPRYSHIHNHYTIKLVLFGNYVADVYNSSGKLKMNHALILVYGDCIRAMQQDFNDYKHKEIMVLRNTNIISTWYKKCKVFFSMNSNVNVYFRSINNYVYMAFVAFVCMFISNIVICILYITRCFELLTL